MTCGTAGATGHSWSAGILALSLATAISIATVEPLQAQQTPGSLITRPTVTAPLASPAPTIDGVLDDPAWKTAGRITEFVQQQPVEGAPATESTEVYISYDAEYLYFGFYVHYSDPALIRANRVDRDQQGNDDTIAVFIDPFRDQQRAFGFSVNGYGVQGDSLLTAGAFLSWNALYSSAGRLVEDGWTAEMAIPVKSLRYPARDEDEVHQWGLQVQRITQSKNETSHWSPVSRSIIGQLAQMGTLDGVRNLSASRNLELMPTATAIRADSRQGRAIGVDHVAEMGLNVKYGLTSELTLEATLNPDFSQIESDRPQIDVNLRFPIVFPELRPFFLEGQDIFRVQVPVTIVHTRTIVDPQFGAKLSGKIGRTALALLVANDQAPGKFVDPSDPAFGTTAMVAAGRVRYDLYPEGFIGALFTDREYLDQHSRLTAIDTNFPWRGRYLSQAKGLFSHHRDGAGVVRTGHFIDLMTRRDGRHLNWLVATNHVSPDFRSDVGFVRRVNHNRVIGQFSYRWWPEHWVTNWGPRLEYDRYHRYSDGVLEDEIRTVGVNALFAKNISGSVTLNRDLERFNDRTFDKTRLSLSASVATSRLVSFNVNMSRGDTIRFVADPFLGRATTYGASVTLRPVARLQSTINLNSSRFVDVRSDTVEFDVKILHAVTTYQFTNRLSMRNILQHNSLSGTLGGNLLLTYRVNAGTVFFVGYDDRYQRGDRFDAALFQTDQFQRTNRALFTKVQYLFRN